MREYIVKSMTYNTNVLLKRKAFKEIISRYIQTLVNTTFARVFLLPSTMLLVFI